MSSRSIPKRIRDFLVDRSGRTYCDDCVQERLGLKWRQQVQVITATLAVTEFFFRCIDVCSTCGRTKSVIQAVPPPEAWTAGRERPALAEGQRQLRD